MDHSADIIAHLIKEFNIAVERLQTSADIIAHLIKEFNIAVERLQTRYSRVVLCELVGLSFADYNKHPGILYHAQQTQLDGAILQVNEYLRASNRARQVVSPCLEGHVHKLTHGILGHRYFGALIDGLHYTEDTVSE